MATGHPQAGLAARMFAADRASRDLGTELPDISFVAQIIAGFRGRSRAAGRLEARY